MGLPHSEIRGSQPSYRLLSAYRRFSRPSSPLNAKASIMCPFSLGHAYLTPCGAGHATSGLCGSGQSHARRTTHARRRLVTRDRSRFNSILRVRSQLASGNPWAACVSGCARPTLHLSKKAHAREANGDRQCYRNHPCRQGGWGAPVRKFRRSNYQQRPLALLAEKATGPRTRGPAECAQLVRCQISPRQAPWARRDRHPWATRRCPRLPLRERPWLHRPAP